jgi:hypothetical protein
MIEATTKTTKVIPSNAPSRSRRLSSIVPPLTTMWRWTL